MKKSHIMGLLFVGALIAYIAANSANYATYADFNKAMNNSNKDFQVIGTLAEGKELHYDPLKDPNYFSFYLVDEKGVEKKVEYIGSKPQDFERSENVVITGRMNGDVFKASKILLKCPSKYIEDKLNEDGLYDIEEASL